MFIWVGCWEISLKLVMKVNSCFSFLLCGYYTFLSSNTTEAKRNESLLQFLQFTRYKRAKDNCLEWWKRPYVSPFMRSVMGFVYIVEMRILFGTVAYQTVGWKAQAGFFRAVMLCRNIKGSI